MGEWVDTRCGHCLTSVLVILHFWTLVYCSVGVRASSVTPCGYRQTAQGSVLTVTLTDPMPTAHGYYIVAERLDDPNIFYHRSRLVNKSEDRMVYEVYDIPPYETHTYVVWNSGTEKSKFDQDIVSRRARNISMQELPRFTTSERRLSPFGVIKQCHR
ncbi:hypothetical protein ACOMHN_045378 [Nucella lapillus]